MTTSTAPTLRPRMDNDTKPAASAATPKPAPKFVTFADFFKQIDEGRFAASTTEELQVLVREMRNLALATGGKVKGRLRVELAFEAKGGVVDVTGDVKLTMPKRPKTTSVFFPTRDNTLTAVSEKQQEMDFRDVTESPDKVRVLK